MLFKGKRFCKNAELILIKNMATVNNIKKNVYNKLWASV